MLRRTRMLNNNVVVTLLSSSPALSRRAQAALQSILHVEPVVARSNNDIDDDLNALFQTTAPLLNNKTRWESLVSNDPVSGTIVHFLSVEGSVENREKEDLSVLSLVQEARHNNNCSSIATSIQKSRTILAEHMSSTAMSGSSFAPSSMMRIATKRLVGRPLTTFDLLGFGGGLPLIQVEQQEEEEATVNDDATTSNIAADEPLQEPRTRFFKELCIPHFDDASYPSDGRTLLSTLSESSSSLDRPAVGLYQFGGLAVRPLPSAKEDRVLPHPSLVFYNDNNIHSDTAASSDDNDDDNTTVVSNINGCRTAKIGFSSSRKGQYMLSHPDLPGLDLRLTDTETFSSHFPEAQQALLAGSLPDLQSDDVLLKGGRTSNDKSSSSSDAMNGLGDCWVEFRANMKQPSGFLKKRNKTSSSAPRVAKVPDIPYE
mmetsp:Transcript_10026/g.16647  ORF Transcript_10026/g.16647 Transcript_10026/m.16647 type:complete len:429 (+) Transcript_10026:171-1457(+)|eukprot:CAMPEP_0119006492 /NCGR_PEP_ID=MMETSP1176-20130426/2321_1 /TAXON_ID=265551 /ORGANISM="Synedropsis recta cf, Strain CCMP1620" /LENGTH=428 /DNA_ID=CAMNT_0006958405 /DNA_START=98 /DNA_END=1384 /DNA_ORIENTATION=-